MRVICSAWLLMLLMLRMFLRFLSFLVGSRSLTSVLGLKKFSVALLSMRAPLVFNVVKRISFIFKVFHLIVNIQHIDSARAATVNKSNSKI